MFIKNHNQYLISENLKQARQYLTKKSIPLDLPEFLHIVNSLKKTPNLIDTFTRMVFIDDLNINSSNDLDVKIREFDRLINWIKSNKNILNQLPKNIIQYKSLEELSDDITQLEQDRKVNMFIKSLYRSMRDEVSKLSGEDREEFDDLAISFMNLSDLEKSQFTPLKYFEKNNISILEFMDSLDKFINGQDVNDNKKRVYDYIKNNTDKLNIPYNEDNILVIQTNDGESVCELGSQKWCIVYAPDSYQKRYFGEDTMNTQYIIYNFNLPSSSRYSMFGVTINIKGEVISGGSQDKMNGFNSLDKIYELTGIPEGTLKSSHVELYDEYMKKYNSLDDNYTYDNLLSIRKDSIKLNLKSDTTTLSMKWLTDYVYSKMSADMDNLRDLIHEVDKMGSELDIGYSSIIDNIKTKYVRLLLKKSNISEIESVDEVSIEVKKLISICDKLSLDDLPIIRSLINWIAIHFYNTDGKYVILSLNKLIHDIDRRYFDSRLFVFLRKDEEGINISSYMLKEITKDRDTMRYYFMHFEELLRITKYVFEDFSELSDWMDLNDVIYLMYIYAFYVLDGDGYNLIISSSPKVSRINYINIPRHLITYQGILDFEKKMPSMIKELSKLHLTNNGIKFTASDIKESFESLISDMVRVYINVDLDERSTFNEIQKVYDEFIYYIEDIAVDFLYRNIVDIFGKYKDESDDIYKFLNKEIEKGLFEYEHLLSDEYMYSLDIDEKFIDNLGLLFINTKSENDIEVCGKSLIMYSAGTHNEKYMNIFKENIGMKYHDKYKVWYMETDYEELGEFFDDPFNFENYWEYFNDYYEYPYYQDHFTDININNLYELSHYLSENGFSDGIDLTVLDKYKENSKLPYINYIDSMKYYRTDRDLNELLLNVESIIDDNYEYDFDNNPYDNIDLDEIRDNINRSYDEAHNRAKQDKYFDDQVSVIGEALLDQWENNVGAFGGSYLNRLGGDTIFVIPNLDKIIETNYQIWERIDEYCGLYSIEISDIIRSYFNTNGRFSWTEDVGYVDMSDDDLNYFNEVLSDRLYENMQLDYIKEETRSILKLSEYMKIQS